MQVEVLVSRAAALGEAALSSSSAKKMAVRPLIRAILKRMYQVVSVCVPGIGDIFQRRRRFQ